jgi:hypothetical protein
MWQKRCLVVAPVLAYVIVMVVMTTLLPSCGSSSTTATPVPTATPITLIVMRICAQAPSNGAACTQATTAEIPLSTQTEFFAQGEFSSNGVSTFNNISQSATWFVNNSLITSQGFGFFTAGTVVGCSCITAASGTVVSPPVLIGVGQPASACSPCPPSPP